MDVKDGILGFAVGDALGVPVEFSSREELQRNPVIDMREFGVHRQPKGTWSDDTSMMIATMDAVSECGEINYDQIANNFCLWANSSKYNPHGKMFDIGITTSKALSNYAQKGFDATKSGCDSYYDNGNGSLMRILPLAYYFKENPTTDLEMASIINDVSSITHRHDISCLGCYLYVKYGISLLEGKSFLESYEDLQNIDVSMYDDSTVKKYERVLSGALKDITDDKEIKSSGFVVDSLEASIWCCLTTKNYEEATLKAVNLGDDTDTIGGLTGGLAGIRYGVKGIPNKWLDVLVQKEYIEDLSNKYQNAIKGVIEVEKHK